jgi:hypothetical protein
MKTGATLSSGGRERQSNYGLSLPNPFQFSQACQVASVSGARDVPQRTVNRLAHLDSWRRKSFSGIKIDFHVTQKHA